MHQYTIYCIDGKYKKTQNASFQLMLPSLFHPKRANDNKNHNNYEKMIQNVSNI